MDKNQVKLIHYIESIEKNPAGPILNTKSIDESYQDLSNKIVDLHKFILEAYKDALKIAAGDFMITMNSRNPLIGPLKEIQSILHHINWQIDQIAIGDFNQSVDYLGDFTNSFNKMINKLKNREFLLKENAQLADTVMSQQTKLLEREFINQVEKYERLSNSTKELRSYRHDMNNHMLCIDSLLQDGNINEARKYIQSLSTIFRSQSIVEYEENYILGALLNEKMRKAEELNTKIIKKVDVHRKINIENIDWCILFGNALDNALEALEKVNEKERKLSIIVKNYNDVLSVKITNSLNEKLIKEGNSFKTTKRDAYLHGLGLSNIKKCIDKYKGEMRITTNEHEFILVFILFGI